MAARYRLNLTEEEKAILFGIINKKKGCAKRVTRAQVLFAVAENGLDKNDVEVSTLYDGLSTKRIVCASVVIRKVFRWRWQARSGRCLKKRSSIDNSVRVN